MKKLVIGHWSLVIFITETAYAMGPPGGGGGTSGIIGILPIVLMFVVVFFLIIFPQQRKQKQHGEMLKGLKKGDRVITSGGLHGTISDIKENIVVLEIDKKVNVNIDKTAIATIREKG